VSYKRITFVFYAKLRFKNKKQKLKRYLSNVKASRFWTLFYFILVEHLNCRWPSPLGIHLIYYFCVLANFAILVTDAFKGIELPNNNESWRIMLIFVPGFFWYIRYSSFIFNSVSLHQNYLVKQDFFIFNINKFSNCDNFYF
jgi:hypothetical protein